MDQHETARRPVRLVRARPVHAAWDRRRPLQRASYAWPHVVAAACALTLLLAVLSPRYGYHRDELYFRMLPPAWGYIDQPPLTPLLVQASIAAFGDSIMAVRLVPIVCAAASLPVLALITREVGGSRGAQALTAWAMAGASLTLIFGHVFLTASLDLLVWPAALLFAIRAVVRDDGRWWVAAGLVIGASSFNKLLVVVLMLGIAVGMALFGPRRWFVSGWLWAGVAAAGLLATPSVLYQASHGWPQLAMGAALSASNADEVRIMMWPMLVLLVGPVLAVFWALAVICLFRRSEWRRLRFLVAVLCIVVAFVAIVGAQFYYTAGVLAVLVALGAVPVANWAATSARRRVIRGLVVLNAAGCLLTVAPVLPEKVFGSTGLDAVNVQSADQVGWPEYAAQIRSAAKRADADVIIAANYGEAGALSRFGSGGVPVVSGHNALWDLARPAADARAVVIVGGQAERARAWFDSCTTVGRLDNRAHVDNEERGEPILRCSGPAEPWPQLWRRFRHLD